MLFIGNSYTYTCDVPGKLNHLLRAAGKTADIESVTSGGYALKAFATPDDEMGRLVDDAFARRAYTYVILQEQSLRPIDETPLFYEGVRMLTAKALANGAKPVLYQTWARKEGHAYLSDSSLTTDQMETKLRAAYEAIASELSLPVAHVGYAFRQVVASNPEIELYHPDRTHPAEAGAYLAACVLYATIYHESPVGLSYDGGLGKAAAHILQTVAGDVWRMPPTLAAADKLSSAGI